MDNIDFGLVQPLDKDNFYFKIDGKDTDKMIDLMVDNNIEYNGTSNPVCFLSSGIMYECLTANEELQPLFTELDILEQAKVSCGVEEIIESVINKNKNELFKSIREDIIEFSK